jgi:hypothetical protein
MTLRYGKFLTSLWKFSKHWSRLLTIVYTGIFWPLKLFRLPKGPFEKVILIVNALFMSLKRPILINFIIFKPKICSPRLLVSTVCSIDFNVRNFFIICITTLYSEWKPLIVIKFGKSHLCKLLHKSNH